MAMKMKVRLLSVLMLCTAVACTDKDDIGVPEIIEENTAIRIDTINVDVVLPNKYITQWMPSISMALQNIARAQYDMKERIWLNMHYHDEDTEDLEQLAYDLTHPKEGDDTCHVIVGPYHSDNAQTFLSHAAKTRLPVVMPTCTSANLQRANARNTYAWFLTESDITQCEIMMSAASSMNANSVALIYSDDTYGHSFYDWFAFFAAEYKLPLAGDGTLKYESGMDITPFLENIAEQNKGQKVIIFLALSNFSDYDIVCEQKKEFITFTLSELPMEEYVGIVCIATDTSYDQEIAEMNKWSGFDYGISPIGDMKYGFPQAYEAASYGRRPYNGEAQVYDALTLIAYGAAYRMKSPNECLIDGKPVVYREAPFGPGLTDYMRAVVANKTGIVVNWTQRGLSLAFDKLNSGESIYVTGATGDMLFDPETHTKILNTSYLFWYLNFRLDDGEQLTEIYPIISLNASNSSYMWSLESTLEQAFEKKNVIEHYLSPLKDHWAVVISPSTTWENYRHQADAFAMYQTLRHHGYDDDHIVFIVEDNLAYDPQNVFPGQIFVDRTDEYTPDDEQQPDTNNDDVRSQAVVDYHFSELRPEDLADIMMGRQSERLPHVIQTDSMSNVFFFWSGHGGSKEGPLWGNEDSEEYFGTDRIRRIVEEMDAANKYRRMMFALETCFSGKWGEALTGINDVLVLTAATPYETSKADVFNEDLGVFLSNAFARMFRKKINDYHFITIYDLFHELFRSTNGSHVSIYNEKNYGSVYVNRMYDYFPE